MRSACDLRCEYRVARERIMPRPCFWFSGRHLDPDQEAPAALAKDAAPISISGSVCWSPMHVGGKMAISTILRSWSHIGGYRASTGTINSSRAQ
jgi:hypothetical protein